MLYLNDSLVLMKAISYQHLMKSYKKEYSLKDFFINNVVAIFSEVEKNYDVEDRWQEFNQVCSILRKLANIFMLYKNK